MGGAQQVLAEDLRARGVDDRRLDRAVQELLGVAGEELVERVLAGDVDGEAAAAAAGASPHLAQAGDGAGEGDADRGVELADVDPELERVGRDHAEQLARDQARLDLVALLRGVAGAVGGDALGQLGRQAVRGHAQDQLDALARLHEADRAGAGGDQLGQQLGGLGQRGGAGSELLVQQRRVPDGDAAGRQRRGVVVDEVDVRQAGEVLGQLDRVGDRRAGEQEAGLRAVDRGGPAEPAQDVGDVRAEHAAVDVGLVDDDEREVREQVAPARVVGQDPDVEHVGVGDHEVRAAADRGALL